MKPGITQTAFRCDNELLVALDAYAKANDLTMAQVIRKALREFLSNLKVKEIENETGTA